MNHFTATVLEWVRTERGTIEPSQIADDLADLRDRAGVKDIPTTGLAREVDEAVRELLAAGRLKRDGEAVVWVPERVEAVAVQVSLF